MSTLSLLQAITEESTLNLLTKTEVKLLKKDKDGNKNLLPKIFKIATQKVVVNKSYEKAVNEQREKEGKSVDFVAEAAGWGGEAKGATFEYNGAHYLKAILLESIGSTYQTEHGDAISVDEFKQFFSTAKSPSRQQVEEEVKVRKFKVESILSFEIVN